LNREWVVDASVGIKLVVPEDLSEAAERLCGQMDEDQAVHLYIPDLFYLECANILWKYVRCGAIPAEKARQGFAILRTLDFDLLASTEVLTPSLDLALTLGITAYDACYVALATWLEVPFVTADEKLIRKLDGSGISVVWLGDL
jgi:predicted nucleic acid-binding protein